jgi:O-antigen/teichoic acid export membrane protein
MSERYRKLLGNTVIFAIGSFSSKALVLLLMPLYTRFLTDAQYGAADLITTTSNLLAPFVMLSINEAVIRFGMDKNARRDRVFSAGLAVLIAGFAVFLLLSPVMLGIKLLSSYTFLIYLYVFAACFKGITAQFVRAVGQVRLYAFDGFLATLSTVILNVFFLVKFSLGATGYVLSIIISNLISVAFLFKAGGLAKYVNLRRIDKGLLGAMLRYSVPLIPTTMFWWITMASDRYFVTWHLGEGANGLYAAAHKLPAVITLVSLVFYQAWQISAVSESEMGVRTTRFYNRIFEYYNCLLFLAASGIILLCRPFTAVWLSASFYESWRYVPFLTVAEVFSTLVTFLGTFYMVSKKNATVPLAIAIGALTNIALNYIFVPIYGALGAAATTVASYCIAYLSRAIDVRRVVKLRIRPLRTGLSLLVLLGQSVLLLAETEKGFLLTQIIFFLMMLLVHIKPAVKMVTSLFNFRMGSKAIAPNRPDPPVEAFQTTGDKNDENGFELFPRPVWEQEPDKPDDSGKDKDYENTGTEDSPTDELRAGFYADRPPGADAVTEPQKESTPALFDIDFDQIPKWDFKPSGIVSAWRSDNTFVDVWNQPFSPGLLERAPPTHAGSGKGDNVTPDDKSNNIFKRKLPLLDENVPFETDFAKFNFADSQYESDSDYLSPEQLRRRFLNRGDQRDEYVADREDT